MTIAEREVRSLTQFKAAVLNLGGPEALEEIEAAFGQGLMGDHANPHEALATIAAYASTADDPLERLIAEEEAELAALDYAA